VKGRGGTEKERKRLKDCKKEKDKERKEKKDTFRKLTLV